MSDSKLRKNRLENTINLIIVGILIYSVYCMNIISGMIMACIRGWQYVIKNNKDDKDKTIFWMIHAIPLIGPFWSIYMFSE